jgi:hypothetical protein
MYEGPKKVKLVYKKNEYEAYAVACGASFTFVIGRTLFIDPTSSKKQTTNIVSRHYFI